MKRTGICPKCGSRDLVRVPDDAHRYLANSICITKLVTVERVPVGRYVCCDCGYVENWVETRRDLDRIKGAFGSMRAGPGPHLRHFSWARRAAVPTAAQPKKGPDAVHPGPFYTKICFAGIHFRQNPSARRSDTSAVRT